MDWIELKALSSVFASTWKQTGKSFLPESVFSSTVSDFGVFIDSQLRMADYVASFCQACFFQLRQIRQVRSSLTKKATKTLAARVRQQPAGLLQQFAVRCQRRLIEEAADGSHCSSACCDVSEKVRSHLTGAA